MRYNAVLLERQIRKSPIVVVGNSSSLNELDLSKLSDFFVIGCNRGLRLSSKGLSQSILMISDRQPYKQEKETGRLSRAARQGMKLLLSDTIFEPKVRCMRVDGSKEDELEAQEEPMFDWYSWRVGLFNTPINGDTFGRTLCSFANVAGQMLQAAMIFGAKAIGCVGIDLKWPDTGPSHFFGDGRSVGAYPCGLLSDTVKCFGKLKELADFRGIKIVNLSPWKNTPFSEVFGNYAYDEWVRREGDIEPVPAQVLQSPELVVPVDGEGQLTARMRRRLRRRRRR